MTVIQITDLHIKIPNSNSFNIDCQNSFGKTLNEAIIRYSPELIVISGDLCQKDPETEVYHYVKNILTASKIPFHVISGNHDDPKSIKAVFYENLHLDSELYFSYVLNGQKIIFLDTTPGIMSETQYDWLTNEVNEAGKEVFVFMHHPPIEGAVLLMDKNYCFKEIDRFSKVTSHFSEKQFYIFTGHYHNERTIIKDNMTVFITPSTYVQINDVMPEMTVYHSKPAYRVIKKENALLTTFVNYMDL
jgi:Icc protein